MRREITFNRNNFQIGFKNYIPRNKSNENCAWPLHRKLQNNQKLKVI